ncbi:putative hydroxypyruvate isomerase [Condylostylus longicornis]|uniref:putative hydroxypyruvate isomerase n=1 Tax=Condylostylus longicornis TaxID=2530218 RepID=UPI00244DE695|nr:putative hydroxypyruvate isomerase [Condylostylus longicornis]
MSLNNKVRNMILKFCANLNFLFAENNAPYLERLYMAKQAGFRGIEISYPDKISLDDLIKTKNETNLELVLMNIKLGSEPDTAFGSTSLPNLENTFQQHFLDTIALAKKLNCHKIHLMSGKVKNESREKHLKTYIKNLKFAVEHLEKEKILGLIEPINGYAVPDYFLNNYKTAVDVIKEIDSPYLKLMVDLYHLQHIQGDVTNSIKELMPIIGHFQIAQVPNRNEPNAFGELNYEYIFDIIKNSGYRGWIGCEYKPKDGTSHGLNWITQYGFKL